MAEWSWNHWEQELLKMIVCLICFPQHGLAVLKTGLAYRAGRNGFFRSLGHNQAAGSGLSPLLGRISLRVSRSKIYKNAETGRLQIALMDVIFRGYNTPSSKQSAHKLSWFCLISLYQELLESHLLHPIHAF